MEIGKKIKQLRELRNFTQTYMAERLNLSLAAYGRIERDETELTLQRLTKIAEILQTDLGTILNFDARNVFTLNGNNIANLNGTIQNQQIVSEDVIKNWMSAVNTDINDLKKEIIELKKRNG
jgi:transcriptional regulator with XRE-family HTH domain